MLKKEHIKQASVEKVAKFTGVLYSQIMNQINESTGYLNDTEKIMCAVLLGDTISGACEEIIGSESVEVIFEHYASEKEKLDNERKNDNQKERGIRSI